MKVAILGGGYIGQQLAAAASKAHHFVVVYDKDPEKCFWCRSGHKKVPVPPILAWDQFKKADVYVVCVNTPMEGPEPVEEAVSSLPGGFLFGKVLLIIESSVPVGFTDAMVEKYHLTKRFHVAHSPERLWPGHELEWPLESIPKLVGGLGREAARKAAKFYRSFMQAPVFEFYDPKITEFAKLYENAQRVVNIAWANEAEELADKLGVDFNQVLKACASKPFGYSPYTPGEAGGSCLPVNAVYLARELGVYSLLYQAMGKARIPWVMELTHDRRYSSAEPTTYKGEPIEVSTSEAIVPWV